MTPSNQPPSPQLQRIQRKRTKGWKMPANTVAVCRPGYWGNPFAVSVFGLEHAIRLYRDMVRGFWNVRALDVPHAIAATELRDGWLRRFQGEHPLEAARVVLRGKNLACWCPLDQPCHADVLLELANATRD